MESILPQFYFDKCFLSMSIIIDLYLQETLLECLGNKFKKERSPLLHLKTVQEMKEKFGAKRQRRGDHLPLEDLAGQQVPV